MKAQVSAVSCHLVRVQTGLGTRLQGSAAMKKIASDLSRFNTNYPTHLTSGAFLLVRLQLCHVPLCLYVRRVNYVRLFHIQEGGSRSPETSCCQTTRKGIPWHSNVHEHFEILSVDKLMLTRLINKFPSPHGTQSFITVFTTASHNVCAASFALHILQSAASN